MRGPYFYELTHVKANNTAHFFFFFLNKICKN